MKPVSLAWHQNNKKSSSTIIKWMKIIYIQSYINKRLLGMSFIPIFRFLSISTFFSGPFDLTLSSYCVKDGKGKISLPKSARLSFMVSMESFIFFLVYEEYRIEAKKRIRLCLLEKAAGKTLPVVLRNAERESTRAVAVKVVFVCFFVQCVCVSVCERECVSALLLWTMRCAFVLLSSCSGVVG